jgi:hypothetical protein
MGTGGSFYPTGEPMGTDVLSSISLLFPIKSEISEIRLICLPPAFTLVSFLAHYLTLKMEAICSSETSDDFQQTTRRYIPEDRTLTNYRCMSYKFILFILVWDAYGVAHSCMCRKVVTFCTYQTPRVVFC